MEKKRKKTLEKKNNKRVNITFLFVKDRNMQPYFYDFHDYET